MRNYTIILLSAILILLITDKGSFLFWTGLISPNSKFCFAVIFGTKMVLKEVPLRMEIVIFYSPLLNLSSKSSLKGQEVWLYSTYNNCVCLQYLSNTQRKGLSAVPQKCNVRVRDHCLSDCHHFRYHDHHCFCAGFLDGAVWMRFGGVHVHAPAKGEKSPIIPSDRLQNEPFGAPSHPPLLIWEGENDTEKLLFISHAIIHSPVSQTSWGQRSMPRWREMAQTLIFTGHDTAPQCFHSLTCASCNRGILPLFIWTQDKATWMKGNSNNQKRSTEDDFSREGMY